MTSKGLKIILFLFFYFFMYINLSLVGCLLVNIACVIFEVL